MKTSSKAVKKSMTIVVDGEQVLNGVMNIGAEAVNSRNRNTKAIDVCIDFQNLKVEGKCTIKIDYLEG